MTDKKQESGQRNYNNFEDKSKQNYNDPKKKQTRIWPALLILIGIFIVAGVVIGLIYNKGKGTNEPTYSDSEPSASIVDSSPELIPDYSGKDTIELNGGQPCFTEYDLKNITGETFSELDKLGRCGTAVAMLHRSMMPTGERDSIADVRPTGWNQNEYPGIIEDSNPPALYNRSHLIAYAMTGQNANEKNLITGTRYMNGTTMLTYEEEILHYLDNTENHVLYRVSPYFKDSELLPRGVEMEAMSAEDHGKAIKFHVFVYNIQPGIDLDYKTGENKATDPEYQKKLEKKAEERSTEDYSKDFDGTYILNVRKKKFHYPSCDGVKDMNEKNKETSTESREKLIEQGFKPCGTCKP